MLLANTMTATVCTALLLSSVANAQRPSVENIVRMHSRYFDIGVPKQIIEKWHSDPNGFTNLIFNGIPWIEDVLDADPYLGHPLFQGTHSSVASLSSRPNETNHPEVVLWSKDRFNNWNAKLTPIAPPKSLELKDFDILVRSVDGVRPRRWAYFPKNTTQKMVVNCADSSRNGYQNSVLGYQCRVLVDYPLDSKIYLHATLFGANRIKNQNEAFQNIANRLLQYAYCLDVTDQITWDAEGNMVYDKKPQPDLLGDIDDCRVEVMM